MAETTLTTYRRAHDRRFWLAFLVILFVLLLLAAIAGESAYSYSESRMMDDIRNQEQLITDIQKKIIIDEIYDPARLVMVLGASPNLRRYADDPVSKLGEFSLFLQNYIDRLDTFSHVHLLNAKGEVIFSYATRQYSLHVPTEMVDPESIMFEQIMKTPKEALYFSLTEVDPHLVGSGETSQLETHEGITLFNAANERVGAIIFGLPFKNISSAIITNDFSKTIIGHFLFVDAQGTYYFNDMERMEGNTSTQTNGQVSFFKDDFQKEWEIISTHPSGQFQTANGIFTYHTIDVTALGAEEDSDAVLAVVSPSPKYILIFHLDNAKLAAARGNFDRIFINIIIFLMISIPFIAYILGLLFSILVSSRDKHRYQANHDVLTGLANRNQFMDRLREILENENVADKPVAIAYFDMDNFKNINDSFGHDAGDDVLAKVAENIRGAIRQGDLVARLGGDEFVVLSMNIQSQTDAYVVGERILNAIHQPIHYGNNVFSLTGSIGIWTIRDASLGLREIIMKADNAMYQAKRQGKNRVVVGQI